MLAIFCLFAPVSIGSMTAGAVLLAQGHSGRLFRYQLVMMLPLAAAMAAGSLAGPAAVAAAKGGYAILYVLGLVAFAGALRRGGGREFLLTLPRVAAAAGLMAAWCLAWIHLLSPGQGLPLRLLLACGAVVTGTVIFAVARPSWTGRVSACCRPWFDWDAGIGAGAAPGRRGIRPRCRRR